MICYNDTNLKSISYFSIDCESFFHGNNRIGHCRSALPRDDLWSPVYITDYSLSSSHFYGYIYDGSNRNIKFDFENVATSDWDGRGYEYGRYGDFYDDYYSRRTRSNGEAVADSIPVQDRTLLCNNQEEGARSILSGTFARK